MDSGDNAQALTQRREEAQSAAFGIGVCLMACLSVGFGGAAILGYTQSHRPKLDGLINPNDASVASLVRLPNIGAIRAEAIVAYREEFRRMQPQGQAFQRPADLQNVRGIGPKTVADLCQWLTFE